MFADPNIFFCSMASAQLFVSKCTRHYLCASLVYIMCCTFNMCSLKFSIVEYFSYLDHHLYISIYFGDVSFFNLFFQGKYLYIFWFNIGNKLVSTYPCGNLSVVPILINLICDTAEICQLSSKSSKVKERCCSSEPELLKNKIYLNMNLQVKVETERIGVIEISKQLVQKP